MLRTGNIDTGPLLQAMMNERGVTRRGQPPGTGGLPNSQLATALMPQQAGAPTFPAGTTPPITPMRNRHIAGLIRIMNRPGM